MDENTKSLFVRFLNTMGQKEVDDKTVSETLEMFCENFFFTFGAIYDMNQYHMFHLHEYYSSDNHHLKDEFSIEMLSDDFWKSVSYHRTFIFDQTTSLNENEIKFLDILNAKDIVLFPVIDNENIIYEIIVLGNCTNKAATKESALKDLLPLFAKYMSIRMYQNKVKFAKNSLESIIDNTGIDIYVNDFYSHEVLYVNKSMAAPYGGVENFMKYKCWQILFPSQTGPCEFCPEKNLIDEEGNPTKVYTWDYQREFDGSWFRVFSAAFRWIDGRTAHVVSSADITDNKRNEELIQYMANYDPLTSLPNRRMLITECDKRINATNEGDEGYILFFDIDGFKNINDNYGHEAGDDFLIQLGQFFLSIPILEDSVYRNGGDEFVAIIDGDKSEMNVRSIAKLIIGRFEKTWKLKAGAVKCQISIGVARYPEDGKTPEELIHKADQAMYAVKKKGGADILFGYEIDKINEKT